MSVPLTALLLSLANPLSSGLPGPVSFSAPPQVSGEGAWMAQKQAGALAPSLQG